MVIYLDKVFFLNSVIDYFLLLTTARLCGASLHRLRLLTCSLFGGLYATIVFLPNFRLLAHPVFRLLFGVLMAAAAFVRIPRPWRLVALFLLLSCTLGGLMLALNLSIGYRSAISLPYARISTGVLLLTTAATYALLHLVFRQGARHGGGELMEIVISIAGQQQRVLALHDTGNTLRDPVNARPVLVVEQAVLLPLWNDGIRGILQDSHTSPEEKMAQLYSCGAGTSFTLLPFRSIGISSGLLLAVCSDYIQIGKATFPKTLVALSSGPINDGGPYQALWGGEGKEEYNESLAKTPDLDHQTQQAG